MEGERREEQELTFKPTFNYLLNKYTKGGTKDRAMKRLRSPMSKNVESDRSK
jgi:hypothetical protein